MKGFIKIGLFFHDCDDFREKVYNFALRKQEWVTARIGENEKIKRIFLCIIFLVLFMLQPLSGCMIYFS